MNAANKLRSGYELSYDDMVDIVLHNDKSFIEYVNEVNNNVYMLLFKDELSTWYSLNYQCDRQKYFLGFIFEGQPKRLEKYDSMIGEEESKQIIGKLKNGEQLSEAEIDLILSEDVRGLDNYIEERGEDSQWSRLMRTFFKTDDNRWFCLPWKAGLAERQENGLWEQPYEIKREVKEIVTKVNVWTPIKKESK